MDVFQNVAILLVGATAFWVFLKLKERIEFLEHEVRWLRKELEELKPTEIRSANDQRLPEPAGTTKHEQAATNDVLCQQQSVC